MLACSEALSGTMDPELAEAIAFCRAVVLAREEKINSVIFASDCICLVQHLNSPARDRSYVGSVVADIKCASSSFLSVTSNMFVRGTM